MRSRIVAVSVMLFLASVAGFGQTPNPAPTPAPSPVPQPYVQTTADPTPDCTQPGTNRACGDQRDSLIADVYLGEAVDNFDGGHGSDSIQTYFGLNFDLDYWHGNGRQ
jgi:hypothetical protein